MHQIKKYGSEEMLHQQVADYLRFQYPDVLFHSDFGSGVHLSIQQAVRQKRLNGGRRSWPDIEIAEPRVVVEEGGEAVTLNNEPVNMYHGLYIELKKDGERLFAVKCKPMDTRRSVDGKVYATDHIREQADVLYGLRQRGYKAEFAVGLDEAKKIIDNYLGGKS